MKSILHYRSLEKGLCRATKQALCTLLSCIITFESGSNNKAPQVRSNIFADSVSSNSYIHIRLYNINTTAAPPWYTAAKLAQPSRLDRLLTSYYKASARVPVIKLELQQILTISTKLSNYSGQSSGHRKTAFDSWDIMSIGSITSFSMMNHAKWESGEPQYTEHQ